MSVAMIARPAVLDSWDPSALWVSPDHARVELGDLSSLVESFREVGILNPLTIKPSGEIVAGQRRLAAWQKAFPGEPVPVRVVYHLDDAVLAKKAERDENRCRLDPLDSEVIALLRQLEELEAPGALARKVEGNSLGGKGGKSLANWPGTSEPAETTRAKAAKAAGITEHRARRLLAIDRAAKDPNMPEAVRETAKEGIEQLDAGTATLGAVDSRVREAKRAAGVLNQKTRQDLKAAKKAPRDKFLQGTRHHDYTRIARETVHTLEGVAMSVALIDDYTQVQVDGEWAASLTASFRALNRFSRSINDQIKETTHVNAEA